MQLLKTLGTVARVPDSDSNGGFSPLRHLASGSSFLSLSALGEQAAGTSVSAAGAGWRRPRLFPEISTGRSQATLLQELSSLEILMSALVACALGHSLPSACSTVHSTRPSDRPLVPPKELPGLVCVVSHWRSQLRVRTM